MLNVYLYIDISNVCSVVGFIYIYIYIYMKLQHCLYTFEWEVTIGVVDRVVSTIN